MGGEETKANLGEKDRPPMSSSEYPRIGRQISTDTYDIGSTHFPTFFWGLMTILTLVGAFLIVFAIIVLNVYEVSYGGVQLALKGQTIDTNLNVLSPAGDATIHLRPGVSWEDAFVIAAELRGKLAVYHGREALEPALELGSDGSLSTAGDTYVGGQVAARGFSSGTQGVTFADGSTMTTAASKLTGTSSETDLNLVAGSKGGSGAIVMSTGLKERVRVDGSGKVFFRGHDSNGAVAGLGTGVLIDGANATAIFDEHLTLTSDGISSLGDIVFDSTGSIVLGSSPSAVTAVEGSLRLEEHSNVEIGSDKASFTVSAQSYAESVVTYLPGGSSSSLATLNATSQGVPQVSPSTVGLVWNSQEACESGEVCVGYAGSAPRWAAVSLALEGVRLEQNATDVVSTNDTASPAMDWVLCRVEGSNGDGVLDVSGAVAVSNDRDYFSGLGMTRHALLEPGTRYVIRCGTKHASGGPFRCDRVSLSMVAL